MLRRLCRKQYAERLFNRNQTIIAYVMSILESILALSAFMLLESCAILGLHYCFKGVAAEDEFHGVQYTGNVFYMVAPCFFEKNKMKRWAKPVYGCYKCMSSFWGTIMFWSAVALFIPFSYKLIPVWLFSIIGLISVNSLMYKRI